MQGNSRNSNGGFCPLECRTHYSARLLSRPTPRGSEEQGTLSKDTHQSKRNTTGQQDHVVVVVRVKYSTVIIIAKIFIEQSEVQ
jgi:hypothetical protein